MRTRATAVAFIVAVACGYLGVLGATSHVSQAWLAGPYRETIYPAMQTTGTTITNAIPFAGADVVLAVLLAAIVVGIVRAHGTRDVRAAYLRIALYTSAAVGAIVFCFYAFWGVWYDRPSLLTRIDYVQQRSNPESLARLAAETEMQLNALASRAHADALDDAAVRAAIVPTYEETIRAFGAPRPIVVSVTKTGSFDPYMNATGITGFMDPFGWDVVIASHLSRWERPFTIAHEWTHLAGFANESEANFSGVLACIRARDPLVRYSGWIAVYDYLPEDARRGMHLGPLVIADLTAIYERFRRDVKKPLSRFQWRQYDRYLKANHVASGITSYNEVTSLLLGTRFGPDNLPLPRG